MDDKAREIAEKRKAQEVLAALLSNRFFCELDPMYWIKTPELDPMYWIKTPVVETPESEPANEPVIKQDRFADRVFPLLAKYHRGEELHDLIKGHRWLANLAVPAERHESARIFHEDPAHNLTILDAFIKLQFCKTWGSLVMKRPLSCIFYEAFIVIGSMLTEEPRPFYSIEPDPDTELSNSLLEKPKLDCIQQDFGDRWESFKTANTENYREEINGLYKPSRGASWFMNIIIFENTREQAMSAFLGKGKDSHAYGVRHFSLEDVILSWTRFKACNLTMRRNPSDENSIRCIDFIPMELWKIWQMTVFRGALDSRPWLTLIDDIWSFCIAAGCPEADRQDPFRSLQALRDLISRQFVYTADLHNMIAKRDKQIILQQRMITALAYRNVIENISANAKGDIRTIKWHHFLEDMFQNAKDGKLPSDHPLKNIFDQHGGEIPRNLLKQMAKDLYSTLSRTIHRFQPSPDFDQYSPIPGQFDPMQIEFLTAMNPTTKDDKEQGSPDWEKERARYAEKEGGDKVSTQVSSAPENDQKNPKKKNKKNQKKYSA